MSPLEVSWGHFSIRLGIETFRIPFSTSLKQESLIQVVSQMGPSGGRQKWELWNQPFPKLCSLLGAGKSRSFSCGSLPLTLHRSSVVSREGLKHQERKYFRIHLLNKTDPGFVLSSGAAQVSSSLLCQKPWNGEQEKGEVVAGENSQQSC